MNYYIDFDSTLYNTPKLSEDMLKALADSICKQKGKSFDEVLGQLKTMFNRENIYNIYNLARYFANVYKIDQNILVSSVEEVITDGNKYVFPDVEKFLRKLRNGSNTINILTYVSQEDLAYQCAKIKGSGISKYFDNIFISSSKKFELDIKYENGIFIDDSPQNLIGLSLNNPKQLIRMRRKGFKYYNDVLDLENLIEIESFDEFKFRLRGKDYVEK